MCAGAGGLRFVRSGHTIEGSIMSGTLNRPAIDVGPRQARPGLALALALLAIPGSTIAWDLPAGGLWIGLPLATAALVLGIRARRQRLGVGMATAAIAIAALVIVQMLVYAAVKSFS
jgi:predicted Kef-type K+ transport protein